MRIAIVKLSALGDIVHAMVVMQFIKKFNNEILIDWIVEESYKDLLDFHPHINKVHIVNLKHAKKKKSVFALIRELNKVHKLNPYDVVVDMQGLLKSAIISKIISSRKTIGFNMESAREKLAPLFYSKTFYYPYSNNIIERNIALIEYALGMKVSEKEIYEKDPFLVVKGSKVNAKFSSNVKNVLLIPGASHISKCYPVDKFIELTKILDANFYISWGNESERKMAMKIKIGSNNTHVLKKMTLDQLVSFISQVDLVIGADTGPTHIAWGLNIPSITLFGPTPGYRNTYSTSINKFIESESIVDPKRINRNDFSIKNISPVKIFDLATKLL